MINKGVNGENQTLLEYFGFISTNIDKAIDLVDETSLTPTGLGPLVLQIFETKRTDFP